MREEMVVSMTDDMKQRIKALAKEQNTSMTEIVRQMIKQCLDK